MKNKIVSTIVVLILTTLILSSCLYFVRAEDNVISNENSLNNKTSNSVNTLSLNEQKEQVSEELAKAEEQLTYVQEELSKAVVDLQKMDDKINEYQATLNQVNSQYSELQQKVSESETKLEEAKEKYEKKLNLLKNRLVAIYKHGETRYLDVLMNSRSIIDFISKYYVVQKITEMDLHGIFYLLFF